MTIYEVYERIKDCSKFTIYITLQNGGQEFYLTHTYNSCLIGNNLSNSYGLLFYNEKYAPLYCENTCFFSEDTLFTNRKNCANTINVSNMLEGQLHNNNSVTIKYKKYT